MARSDSGSSYLTPASITSQEINSLLQTEDFVKDIVTRSDLDKVVASGVVTLSDMLKK